MSIIQFVKKSICQGVEMSISQFIKKSICQEVDKSVCKEVKQSVSQDKNVVEDDNYDIELLKNKKIGNMGITSGALAVSFTTLSNKQTGEQPGS